MAQGDTFPSAKIAYVDPETGKTSYRLTVDGTLAGGFQAANYFQDMAGEQSASSAWSLDNVRLCYAKGVVSGSAKPAGIYMMNTSTGVETHLAPVSSPFLCYPVWSRAGSDEVYYMDTSGTNVRIRAVLTAAPWTIRDLGLIPSNGQRQKLGINSTGTLVSAHIQPLAGGAYRTIIVQTNGLGTLPGWDINGPASADGSVWHATNPFILGASRGNGPNSIRMYNVTTLIQVHVTNFRSSHIAFHPNGTRLQQIDSGCIRDVNTGALITPDKGGQGAIHPFYFPSDLALGTSARFLADEAPFFFNPYDRPMLWTCSIDQFLASPNTGIQQSNCHRAGVKLGLHWSASSSNSAHPHPMASPDGSKVAWVSDKQWRPALDSPIFPGTTLADHFPGDPAGATDLFMTLTGGGSSSTQASLGTTAGLVGALQLNIIKAGDLGVSASLTATGIPVEGELPATADLVALLELNINLEGDLGVEAGLEAGPNNDILVNPEIVEFVSALITPASVTTGTLVVTPLIVSGFTQLLAGFHVTNGAVPMLHTIRVTGTFTIQFEDVNDGIGE